MGEWLVVDGENIGEKLAVASSCEEFVAPMEAVVILSEKEIRTVGRHLRNDRSSISQRASIHVIGRDERTDFGDRGDGAWITVGRPRLHRALGTMGGRIVDPR